MNKISDLDRLPTKEELRAIYPKGSREETILRHHRLLQVRFSGAPLARCGAVVGVSTERARQIEATILLRIRQHKAKQVDLLEPRQFKPAAQQVKPAPIVTDIYFRDALRITVSKAIIDLNRYASETGDKRFHDTMMALAFALTDDARDMKAQLEREVRTQLDKLIELATAVTKAANSQA